MAEGSALNCPLENCIDINDTFVLTSSGTDTYSPADGGGPYTACFWIYLGDAWCRYGYVMDIRAFLYDTGDDIVLDIVIGLSLPVYSVVTFRKTWASVATIDCTAIDDDLTIADDPGVYCDASAATCHATAL